MGGAHRDHESIANEIKISIIKNLKIFEKFTKDEIYDHRKAKFLQIGRDKGFSKSTNINDTSLTYKESGMIKLKSHFVKFKYMYGALGFLTLIGLIYTLFSQCCTKTIASNNFILLLTFIMQICLR